MPYKDPQKRQEVTNRWNKQLRFTALETYGSICACCGEDNPKFLAIDHINGGGNKHRRELGITSGLQFLCWLRRNDWPEGFQVLCHNCNFAKGHYNQCPHKELS